MSDPDSNKEISLTEDEAQAITSWLEEKLEEELICPLCKQDQWQVMGHLVTTPILHGGHTYSAPNYPYAGLFCKNCGHTLFFNAVVIGISESEYKKDG